MNDYIKREDVLSEISYHESRGGNIAASIRNAIRRLPAADVRENVRGEWMGTTMLCEQVLCRCSACGTEAPIGWYCLWCGAKMRGEKDV